ncbi:hypothetical protein FGG08_004578 [Glutinoglossum americanum]|uniref:Glycoprotease family protein n=1 Tax=Glutinoglossum americanum TaxID=1670608 RepID=A0A9P8L2D2_9PEZI|nr:hypothetical protein FGG08_004578 [Glutinoglossum americanum]
MPFSSPISEEAASPVSPLGAPRALQLFPKILDPFSSPPLSPDDTIISDTGSGETRGSSISFDGTSPGSSPQIAHSDNLAIEAARAATRNATPRSIRNYSVSKSSRDKSRRSKKQDVRRSKPGIRVVTNFSKPHDLGQAASRQPGNTNQAIMRQGSIQRQGQQAGAFVSLSDLKAIDGGVAPVGFWKSVAGDSHKQKRKDKTKVESTKATEKRKQPILSGTSPQKSKTLGFKFKTLRQNTRNYEDISDREDEVPILAASDADAAVRPTRPVSTEKPDNGITADMGIVNHREKSLAPSPTKTEDGLSPSDRPIVIGLSIPSGKLAEFQFSPQSASPDSVNLTRNHDGHRRDPSEATTATPTILVTPASEGSSHVLFQMEQAPKGRPRARSSIYSQPGMSPAVMADAIPPIPTVPNAHKIRKPENPFEAEANNVRDSSITVFEEDEEPKAKGRGVSTYTVFEEDESPTELQSGRHRSGSGGGSGSPDTAGAHRRSLGWWNYLLTPFLTRSNTTTERHQRDSSDKWDRPVLPSLAQAATVVSLQEERDEKSWEKEFSPDTEAPVRPKSGHTTMWSDLSTWEDERETIGIAIDHTPRTSTQKPKAGHRAHKSSETIPVMMAADSARASDSGDFQKIHQRNRHNPFRQAEEHKVEVETHSQGSNPVYPIFDPKAIPEARRLSGCETAGREGHVVPNPFSDAYQQTSRQGQNPFLHDPPGSPNIVSHPEPVARLRSDSEATEFEEDDGSPIVRDVKNSATHSPGAAIGAMGEGAAEMQNPKHHAAIESAQPPPYSPPRNGKFQPFVVTQPPILPATAYRQPDSPGPLSPGVNQILSSSGAIPMSDVALTPPPSSMQQTGVIATDQRDLYMRPRAVPITLADLERPSGTRQNAEARRQRLEREDALGRKLGGLWRGRGCFSSKGCFGRGGAGGRKRRRWTFGLAIGFVLVTILVIVLATTLHKKRPAKTLTGGPQWLNLTNFPPMPTGVNTVMQPDVVSAVTACVFPSTMWSCSLPKELQQSALPNDPDQPNFKLQVLFRNDSTPTPTGTNSSKRTRNVAWNAVSARGVIRENILIARDAIVDAIWQPAPSPPSLEDQRFLGNTTDKVQSPLKEGEATPFYISFLPNTPPTQKFTKRQRQNSSGSFPDLTADIPPPDLAADGTAAPANLLPSPLPLQQPVRLYDRGLPTEHYGFYNYFDRSIFLKSTAMLNRSDIGLGEIPADRNGGSTESEAQVRCTWAQTRFLVQIWTNIGNQQLIRPSNDSSASTNSSSNSPGSFPYPVSITIDRHGGDANKKKVYCYGMDLRERIIPEKKQVALENRRFGGTLVGGGQGPLGRKISVADGGLGGIDGGTGGCQCEWRNFRD